MPTVDELRGVPPGNTLKDRRAAEVLKRAAVTVGITVATTFPTVAKTNQVQNHNDNHHKVEVFENSVNKVNQAEDSSGTVAYSDYADTYQSDEQTMILDDIKVSYSDGAYVVEGADGSYKIFSQEELNRKIARKENREHRKTFAEPTQYKEVILDKVEELSDTNLAEYDAENNVIIEYDTNIRSEDIKQQKSYEADSSIARTSAYENAKSFEYVKDNPEVRESIIAHEKTHRDDYASGALKSTQITHEQAAKLNMAMEIKATMTQVKLSYDECKKTGNMDDLKGWHAKDLQEFKEWFKQNPNSPEAEQRLAKAVYEGWMKDNNQVGTNYYKQAMDAARMQTADINVGEKVAGAKFENEANIQQYHEQWDTLFKNTAFGDVRNVVNADFELGNGTTLQPLEQKQADKSSVDKFLEKIVDGSKSVRKATQKLSSFFKKVKKVDRDGVRTPKEERKIQKIVGTIQSKRGVNMVSNEVQKSGGSTKVNIQTNTNAPDMQTIMQQGKGRV